MADLVKLAIVYDTQAAAQKLSELERLLEAVSNNTKALNQSTNRIRATMGGAGTSFRGTSRAAVGLAQALATGNVSATALTSRLATLGGRLGTIGLVIAAVAGVLLLFKRNADKAREAGIQFHNQLRDVKRAVDELLRPDARPELQGQIEKITDAITELDRTLARQRLNILERLFGGLSLKEGLQGIKRFIVGGEDPATRRHREGLSGQRERLTPEALRSREIARAQEALNRIPGQSQLLRGSRVQEMAEQISVLQKHIEALLDQGVKPWDFAIVQTSKSLEESMQALRRVERAEHLMRKGLESMADALEDFVVTGTLAFTDFLNNILRLLYRDAADELMHGIVRSAFSSGTPTAAGDKDVTGIPKTAGLQPSVVSNVNLTIQAIDTQSGVAFLEQHGPRIASIVTGAAERSQGMRRKLGRG